MHVEKVSPLLFVITILFASTRNSMLVAPTADAHGKG
jgi:hypothetical protein